jgi:hypothetical protein
MPHFREWGKAPLSLLVTFESLTSTFGPLLKLVPLTFRPLIKLAHPHFLVYLQ